ncbi:hypothetical protein C0580_00885 [Candidatus Parcubacteria bacterium]|nr:MAG: hypothetical protein C0580_00885 [Candidatus Parcubacteria bacterium]
MKRKGFTLIELLIIIAIIGIISTVAVVNLNSSRDKAKEAELIAAIGQMQKAATLCIYDNLDLRCGSKNCLGDQDSRPVAGDSICTGSDIKWPSFEDPNIDWGVAWSDRSELEFCFELSWEDPNIVYQGGGFYSKQYYCTNQSCSTQPTSASPCSLSGCESLFGSCSDSSDCCGGLICNGGTCQEYQVGS